MPPLRALRVCSCLLLAGSPTAVFGQGDAAERVRAPDPVYLIIRTDDVGMSHSVNMAVQRLIATRLPLSVSVMFACPWYQETVEILKQHPQVAVGIHLVLNSEWKHYRWGPVTGREAVPTLVMSKNRQGELDALTSQRFTGALKARNVLLMTYRDLIGRQGLQAMRRPAQ